MFKDWGYEQWANLCINLLNNNSGKPTAPGTDKGILEKQEEILRREPNNSVALLTKGFALFNFGKKEANLDLKIKNLLIH